MTSGRPEHDPEANRPQSDDIKDFAQSTMNELLRWYGYEEKIDCKDTMGLNLKKFSNDSTSSSSNEDEKQKHDEKICKGESSSSRLIRQPHCSNNRTVVKEEIETEVIEKDVDEKEVLCTWCQRLGRKLFSMKTNLGTKVFCSELCFAQCRRACFKRSKICDWCKHIRHTVNYVDFEDGDQQLQFCGDKCLNQYKMNIFCMEAEAHLNMHPQFKSRDSEANSRNLITPEMWLQSSNSEAAAKTNQNLLKSLPRSRKRKLRRKCDKRNSVASSSTLNDFDNSSSSSFESTSKVSPKAEAHVPPVSVECNEVPKQHFQVPNEPSQAVLGENSVPDNKSSLLSFPFGNTVVVPYPVFVPLPIPIPIPLPLQNDDVAKVFQKYYSKTGTDENGDEKKIPTEECKKDKIEPKSSKKGKLKIVLKRC